MWACAHQTLLRSCHRGKCLPENRVKRRKQTPEPLPIEICPRIQRELPICACPKIIFLLGGLFAIKRYDTQAIR